MIRFLALLLLAVATSPLFAQDAGVQEAELEDVDVSYIYPVVWVAASTRSTGVG